MPVVWSLAHKRSLVRWRRLVSEGTERLVAQQQRVKTVRRGGHNVSDAEHLLHTLEDSQLAMYGYLARQER
jgi:hypothetical protein